MEQPKPTEEIMLQQTWAAVAVITQSVIASALAHAFETKLINDLDKANLETTVEDFAVELNEMELPCLTRTEIRKAISNTRSFLSYKS